MKWSLSSERFRDILSKSSEFCCFFCYANVQFSRHTSSVFEPKILFMIPNLPEKLDRLSRLKSGLDCWPPAAFLCKSSEIFQYNERRDRRAIGFKFFLKSHLNILELDEHIDQLFFYSHWLRPTCKTWTRMLGNHYHVFSV